MPNGEDHPVEEPDRSAQVDFERVRAEVFDELRASESERHRLYLNQTPPDTTLGHTLDHTHVTVGFDASVRDDRGVVVVSSVDGSAWTDVGWTTADGLTYAPTDEPYVISSPDRTLWSHTGRDIMADIRDLARRYGAPAAPADIQTSAPAPRVTPGQATTGSVVDRIDAAVAELCGCGCRQRLRPDGPSATFYSQGCQSRWMNAQATNPTDVYIREDAHDGNIEMPTEMRGAEPRRGLRPGAIVADALLAYLGRRDRDQRYREQTLNWRRYCPHCRQRGEPQEFGGEQVDVASFGLTERIRSTDNPYRHQRCRRCGYVWPGPPIRTSVINDYAYERGYVVLRMEAGSQQVDISLSVAYLENSLSAHDYVNQAWDDLERQLLRSPGERERQRELDRRMSAWADAWAQTLRFAASVTRPEDSITITDT